jgi:hypothetical protein
MLVEIVFIMQAALEAVVLEAQEQVLVMYITARAVMAALEQYRVLQDLLFNTLVVGVAPLMFPKVIRVA